ncbi:hypothetical protein Aperf_G00000108177 [Anoplocephala perfoliata]
MLQYLISTFALLYLQALMMYYNRKMAKREIIRQKIMEGVTRRGNDEEEDDRGESPSSLQEDLHSLSSENNGKDSLDNTPEETPSTTPDYEKSEMHYDLSQQASSDSNQSSSKDSFQNESTATGPHPILLQKSNNLQKSKSNLSVNLQERNPAKVAVTFKAPLNRRPTKLGRMFGDSLGSFSETNPPFTRVPEGINLYLRLGTVLFGFGVMIMDGFRIADQFRMVNGAMNCHSVLWIPVNAIHTIYIFMQTYFLFKFHRIAFNVQKFFIRFIMCHMAVANLGQWLSTVVQEVISSEEEMVHMDSHNMTNVALRGIEDHVTHHANCNSQAIMIVHYLIPCGVEYSLIASAIFYKMFQRIDDVRQRIRLLKKNKLEHLKMKTSEVRPKPLVGLSSDDSTECHRAHKGLFFGLLLFLATFVALALISIFLRRHEYFIAMYIYQINNFILIVSGIIAVSAALIRLRVLDLRELSEEDAFDDNLLLIGLLAVLFYDMFLLVPAIGARNEFRRDGAIFVGKAILEMTQALLQVFLILEVSRRKSGTIEDTIQKPGRSLITFLLVINLAMWVMNTTILKYTENHEIFRAYYSALPWKIITHLCLPLIIFFRFHSTVCLADIWTNAYKMQEGKQV